MAGAAPAAGNTPSKPEAAKPADAKSTDPHAGHGHGADQAGPKPSDGKQVDPVNGLMVDPATAPKTTYQGQTYYFCAPGCKKAFEAEPETYLDPNYKPSM